MTGVIKIDRVSKRFGERLVLDSVTLDVYEGTVLALLGSSGSGKSTLAHIVCGLVRPDGGQVLARFRELAPDSTAACSLMPQQLGLWAALTVHQQVRLVLHSRRARFHSRTSTLDLLEIGGLLHRRGAYVDELSGGELRRLAFLKAIAVSCNVLVLDEPFASVDAYTESTMQRVLGQYRQEISCAVVLVTHDFEHALRLADRVAVLDGGRIVQCGVPLAVAAAPATANVARTLGWINVWPVHGLRDGRAVVSWGEVECSLDSWQSGASSRLAYCVPHEAIGITSGDARCEGRLAAIVGGHRVLRLTLQVNNSKTLVDVGVMVGAPGVNDVRVGQLVGVTWPLASALLIESA